MRTKRERSRDRRGNRKKEVENCGAEEGEKGGRREAGRDETGKRGGICVVESRGRGGKEGRSGERGRETEDIEDEEEYWYHTVIMK